MKIHEAASPEFEALSGTDIFVHGHLPIVSAYCRRLGLAETVDRMVPSQMQLRPGLAVQTMVLDVLSGRSPLYRVQEFMAEQDVELLLGEHVPAEMFNDTNLGRSLDAVFTAGTSKIITEMGVRAASIFGLDTGKVSYDTTSTSVWGDYQSCAGDDCPPGPVVTWGHSKDHRPDLKQFMTELLCVDSAVPIFGKTLDGNSSDKTSNNEILSRISSLMARHGLEEGAFVYVADSAMVTEGNLSAMGGNRFVSRLPANYAECGRAIAAAVAEGQWHHAGRLAETPTGVNRPNAEYKLQERVVNLHGTDYRAVVVHSSSHDRRRRKKVDRILAESQKALVAELGKLETVYFCRADAEAAAAKVGTLAGKMHSTVPEITETCRRKRGRPPKDGPASTTTRYMLSWRIVEDTAAVEKARAEAGCFVLLTNVPLPGEGGMDARELLKTYKGQYGVENNFSFLKDPLVVNDLFLKTPSRIDALGMVFVLALMVWRLMERSMRTHLKNTKTTLTGWRNRKTDRPTAFMMTTAMTGIMVAKGAGKRHFLNKPKPRQIEFIEALGVAVDAFINTRYRCEIITPGIGP